jgi:phosphate-selective porin OprO/OprP
MPHAVLTGTTLAFAALAAPLAVASPADEADARIEELIRRNDELAAKVERLERNQADDGTWLTEARAAEIRAIVQDTLADADTRASLQGDGATGGWNKGFFLASPDGSFRMNIKGQIQVRWAYDYRERPEGANPNWNGADSENTWGWEIRRAKIAFTGYVVDPSWEYEFQPIWNRNGGSSGGGTIENMYIRKTFSSFGGATAIRVGQYKAPFNKEELVSSSRQLAAERSLVSDVFTTKFSQGIELTQTWDAFRLTGFYGDRMRANATIANTSAGAAAPVLESANSSAYASAFQVDYALAGRAEWKPFGTWKQLDDLTSFAGEEAGLGFGVGVMAQNFRGVPATATAGGVTFLNPSSMWGLTGDVTADFGGLSLFASGIYRQVQLGADALTRGGGRNDTMDQWGVVVQAGLFVAEDLEPFVRYELGNTDTDQYRVANAAARAVDAEGDNLVTVGANWYPAGSSNKDLKLTGDVGFSFVPIVDFRSTGANWQQALAPPAGGNYDATQVVVRMQLQLLF